MYKYNFHLLFVLLTLLLMSCEEIIEFKGESIQPKIVMYAILDPENNVSISLAKSYPVFEWNYIPKQIPNAQVRLYRDDIHIETLMYQSAEELSEFNMFPNQFSVYASQSVKPLPGSTYRIEVDVPGFSTVTGEVVFPTFVPILKIDTMRVINSVSSDSIMARYYNNQYLQTRITIKDPPGEENYYRIRVLRKDGFYNGPKSEPYSNEYPVLVTPFSHSPVQFDPIMQPVQENELFGVVIPNFFNIFSDELIAGKDYVLNLKIFESTRLPAYHEFYIYHIELHSISKDNYLYLRSLSAHQETEGEFISEPVIVYSNIQNGLGFMGSQLVSRYIIYNGEYPVDGVKYEDVEHNSYVFK
jgi:hypothetical protein